ncbi:Rieske 2Fe-2S domain-containing protein [Variovorax sp. M-6]|uniref:Rieske 2Fe-2S domain-containing protein n=1 Tax=Variovorax sp. M-6 TaxID=3233041 RepID=UPI003F948472
MTVESTNPTTTSFQTIAMPVPREVFPPQGVGGYDQCWYPLALSSEVAAGEVIGRAFLSGRVAIFRGENGKAVVLSAYCSHYGADLSVGKVIGNNLRCAFHYWQYGQDGKCNHIASGDRIPAAAMQFRFPTLEVAGIIWAFNGLEPLYEHPLADINEADYVIRATKIRDFPIDPGLFMCNTFDFQHFRVVHGLRPEGDRDPEPTFEQYRVLYNINMSPPDGYALEYRLAVVGTNKFVIDGKFDGKRVRGIYAATPTPNNHSANFMVSCAPRAPSGSAEEAEVEALLDTVTKLRDRIVSEDWPILSAMRHPRFGLLTKSDTMLGRFVLYLRKYPRAHPSAAYIG